MSFKAGEVVVLINSDASQVSKKKKSIEKLCKNNSLTAHFIDGRDIDAAVRKALKSKRIKRLIIGGGDGSVRTAASLVNRMRPDVIIGIVPVGTANYYARSLGSTHSLTKSFTIAMSDNIERRHLSRANGRDFLLGVNLGYTSHMFAEITDAEKKRYGRLAYVRGLFRVFRRLSPPMVQIIINGHERTYATTELVVLNQYLKGSFPLLPRVKGSDPYFEIITYGLDDSKLSPLIAAATFIVTLGKSQRYLKRIPATQAKITSTSPQPVAIDGDSLEQTPLDVEIIKKPVIFARSTVK